jgi:catechol 2,3-dioxygenase
MDAPNPSAIPTAASRAPLHIGGVGLIVRDLERMTAYYRELLGLDVARTEQGAALGVAGVPFLDLIHKPDALPDDPREAGLYHTAFLMPARADLARWILHVAKNRVPVTGASDHDVSEAIYLDDPEGNGVEVYVDRPRSAWKIDGQTIFQKTEHLDVEAIISEIDPATATYDAAPAGLRVGHIHLRCGDTQQAEAFYVRALGLEVTRRRYGATFMSTGGYHHHVAANIWHSDGAGPRSGKRGGLDWFTIEANDAAILEATRARLTAAGVAIEERDGGFAATDPSGIGVRFAAAKE